MLAAEVCHVLKEYNVLLYITKPSEITVTTSQNNKTTLQGFG